MADDAVIVKVRVIPLLTEDGKRYKIGIYKITGGTSYPTGGYTINVASEFTCIDTVNITKTAAGSGILPAVDSSNFGPTPTTTGVFLLKMYRVAAHTHVLWIATGATDATGARVNAATNSLAMNNAAAAIAGIAAASGAAGGIVTAAEADLSEVAAATNVGTTVCYAEVLGYF